jgi:tRNA threonylcarbamoyladenosine biosynthesis protein TsaE
MSFHSSKRIGRENWSGNWLKTGETWEKVTHSPEETVEFGSGLAKQISPPCLILLEGELGSGKTTLVKGIVQGLGEAREEDVTSPTFALVHEYGKPGRVYHIDLYRIESSQELATLGLDEILARDAIVLVEWGEKLGGTLADSVVRIRMEYAGNESRKIIVRRSNAST